MRRNRQTPHVDDQLVNYLMEKYPLTEWKSGTNSDTFLHDAIFRAGQREVINKLAVMVKQQEDK
jgi:hypothetical protein